MIEIADGLFVDIDSITALKRISDKSCTLWVNGQSALDGFVVKTPVENVLAAIHAYYNDDWDDDDGDDDSEEVYDA